MPLNAPSKVQLPWLSMSADRRCPGSSELYQATVGDGEAGTRNRVEQARVSHDSPIT